MPAAKNSPGEWGTAQTALIMSEFGWEHLHPLLNTRMGHVHTYDGGLDRQTCVRNVFGPLCGAR